MSGLFKMVVVLYNLTFLESTTITSLNKLLASGSFPEITEVLIFDNSSESTTPSGLEQRFSYYHSGENVGLARAYNYALEQINPAVEWLVTLDQDTVISREYLNELIVKASKLPKTVVAIAPIIKDQQQQISPVRSDTLRPLHKTLPKPDHTYFQDIMVINSATAVRIDFLQKIGGYNEGFPLDYLDHWLSWRIFNEQQKITILKHSLQHQLSVLDYGHLMNETRYLMILQAEERYYLQYARPLLGQYRRQLFFRGCKQIVTGRINYGKKTFKFLFLGGKDGNKGTKAE